jgi:hypothetical protein
MSHRWFKHLVRDAANDGGGASGGAAGGSGAAGAGGSGGGAADGAGNNSGGGSGDGAGAPAAGGDGDVLFGEDGAAANAGNPAGASGSAGQGAGQGQGQGQNSNGVVIPENWKDALPDELKNDATIGKYKTVDALARGLKEAARMVGADKIVVPAKGTPLAQMKEVFTKLGLPENEADYKFEVEAANKDVVDPKFMDSFKKLAYGMNMLPEQAKQIVDYLAKTSIDATKQQMQEQATATAAGLKALQTEWGANFKNEVAKSKAAVKEFTSKEDYEALKALGIGNHPAFLRLMNKVGGTLSEDKIRGEGGTLNGALTVAQARAKINEIKKDLNGAYYNKNHADHAETKKTMTALYAQAFPGPVQSPPPGREKV